MLGQSVAPVFLFTVHDHVRPIGGNGCHAWGPPWLPALLEGSTRPSGEAKVCQEGRVLLCLRFRCQAL
jgi:hypothetical protein